MRTFDKQDPGFLMDEYRWKHSAGFQYLYLCKKCARSFETKKETQACKFCSSPVKELLDETTNSILKKNKYYYSCKSCGKKEIIHVKKKTCVCGAEIATINMNRINPYVRFSIKMKPRVGALRKNLATINDSKTYSESLNKTRAFFSNIAPRIRLYEKTNREKEKFHFPRLTRTKEELPTY
jgi:DNA-directed RNA polymerase subunit RPC12/RpoP